jgi:thiamine kinase-like enzyme
MNENIKFIYQQCKESLWKDTEINDITFDIPDTGFSQTVIIAKSKKDNKNIYIIKFPNDNNVYRDHQIKLLNIIKESDVVNHIPSVIFTHKKFYVEEFIHGEQMKIEDLTDNNSINNISRELNILHKIEVPTDNFRTSLDILRDIYESIHSKCTIINQWNDNEREIHIVFVNRLIQLSNSYFDMAEHIFKTFDKLVVSHNDVHYENIIQIKNSNGDKEIRLIDYEFVSLNHPEYDLVNLYEETRIASENKITLVEIRNMLSSDDQMELFIYNNIFWFLWSINKIIQNYNKENLNSYIYYSSLRFDSLETLLNDLNFNDN